MKNVLLMAIIHLVGGPYTQNREKKAKPLDRLMTINYNKLMVINLFERGYDGHVNVNQATHIIRSPFVIRGERL